MEKREIAKKNILRKSKKIAGEKVEGYNFDEGIDYSKILDSFMNTGSQATNFGKAVKIIKEMRKENAFIYLGYTSNMITTGIREIIKYLVKTKKVNYLVTTAGGIEEDFIKCFGKFLLGDFFSNDKKLRNIGVNRAGNILIPNSLYVKFEKFVFKVLEKYEDKIKYSSDLIYYLSKEIKNEDSVYFWAYKNKIPVYCPAITDGSLGDILYFYRNYKRRNFEIDVLKDSEDFNNSTIGKRKTGIIILGGGIVKHTICNANMYRDGADYAVYINSFNEFDSSDSGARPEEAISWGKINRKAKYVKVYGDATIIFPLIVAKSFV